MSRSIGEALRDAVHQLEAAGIDGAARDARALVAAAVGVDRERLGLMLGEAMEPEAEDRLRDFVKARLARQPVSQITGARLFWGRRFAVTPDVLDPRPETEILIARALAAGAAKRLLDLGTGTGILALTLLAEWPDARAVAIDLSPKALDVARRNADALGVAGRVAFHRSDWWQSVEGSFDLILSNPPYIPSGEMSALAPEVRDWEPSLALTAGEDGLAAYRAIAARLDRHLAPGGRALLEFGDGQGPAVANIFTANDVFQVGLFPDLDGRLRIAEVTRNA